MWQHIKTMWQPVRLACLRHRATYPIEICGLLAARSCWLTSWLMEWFGGGGALDRSSSGKSATAVTNNRKHPSALQRSINDYDRHRWLYSSPDFALSFKISPIKTDVRPERVQQQWWPTTANTLPHYNGPLTIMIIFCSLCAFFQIVFDQNWWSTLSQ